MTGEILFTGITDEYGDFAFEFDETDDTEIYTTTITGGTNLSTGLPFDGILEETTYDESDAEEDVNSDCLLQPVINTK